MQFINTIYAGLAKSFISNLILWNFVFSSCRRWLLRISRKIQHRIGKLILNDFCVNWLSNCWHPKINLGKFPGRLFYFATLLTFFSSWNSDFESCLRNLYTINLIIHPINEWESFTKENLYFTQKKNFPFALISKYGVAGLYEPGMYSWELADLLNSIEWIYYFTEA